MKILVTVKEVSVLDDEFEIDGDIDERYVTRELNEWDEYAIEAAVQLQEAREDVEVVAVTIGPEETEETVRQALAKGPDRAVRLWDDRLGEAAPLDTATKARLLAAVARVEEPDLVLTGVQSADESFAATGVALAERLGFEWAAVVNEFDLDSGVASVHRELEGGVEELTDVELPAVLTIQTGINDPRYASLRGIRAAQSKELTVQSLDDLGIDASDVESPLTRTELYRPDSGGETTLFEGEGAAEELAAVLSDRGVGQ